MTDGTDQRGEFVGLDVSEVHGAPSAACAVPRRMLEQVHLTEIRE
jgi:hypothetical protein